MQTEKHINISVVGCGMWGRNIARNCASLGLLHSVVDTDPERAGELIMTARKPWFEAGPEPLDSVAST